MPGTDIFDVRDRIVIVTGALGLLGRQYTFGLLERGACVVAMDWVQDTSRVQERFGDKAAHPNLFYINADVTQRPMLEDALTQIKQRWGAPYGLVNNAALDFPPNAPASENGPFELYTDESWDKVMDVNVKGVFHCCQVFGGSMAQEGRGSIINISSMYGMISPDQSLYEYRRRDGEAFYKPVTYSVSKSALFNLSRYLATYWGEQNVRVNTLTFGGVYNSQDPDFLSKYYARVPLRRMAKQDEYVGAVIFLVSDASSYMTGSNLVIDGGYTAW